MRQAKTTRQKLNTRIFKAVHQPQPDLQHLLGRPRPRPRRPRPRGRRPPGGHHQRRLQRPRLPPRRHRRSQRRRRQPDPERSAGAEARRHPRPGPRFVLRAVRPGPSPFARADVPRRAPPATVAVGPGILGQAHQLLPGQGLAQSFYYRGTSGLLAKLVLVNAHVLHRLREPIERPAGGRHRRRAADDLRNEAFATRIWTPWLRWFLSPQLDADPARRALAAARPDHHAISRRRGRSSSATRWRRSVAELPFRDNYFWRVYFQGLYTPDCCPEYLKRGELPDAAQRCCRRLQIHTATVTDFLRSARSRASSRSCCWTTWTG